MPQISAGVSLKRDDDARHHLWWTLHNVFPAHLMCAGRPCSIGVTQWQRIAYEVVIHGKASADRVSESAPCGDELDVCLA